MSRIKDPLFGYKVNVREEEAYLKKYGNRELINTIPEPIDVFGTNEFLWDAIPDLKRKDYYFLKYQGNQPHQVLQKYDELYDGAADLVTVSLALTPIDKTINFEPGNKLTRPGIRFFNQKDNILFGSDLRTKREVICTLYGPKNESGMYLPNMVKIQINGDWKDNHFIIGQPSIWNNYSYHNLK